MLITLSAFLAHTGNTSLRLIDFVSNHTGSIVKIVLLNALMLFFGFIGEIGLLNPYISTLLGFIPFIINFKYIKDTFLPSAAPSEFKIPNSEHVSEPIHATIPNFGIPNHSRGLIPKSDSEDNLKKWLFYWFVFFWSLYGVFAVMNYTTKNVGYNILDIFSKNFFGIFLAYIVMLKSQKQKTAILNSEEFRKV
jgi:hypothetical protein